MVNSHVFSHILDSVSAREWQIVQQREVLHILLTEDQGELQEEALLEAVRQALAAQGVSLPSVRIEHVAAIPRNESGKAIPFVTRLS